MERAIRDAARRKENTIRLRRRIESGMVPGTVRSDGSVVLRTPKGIQNWHSTRELIERVTTIMDRYEASCGVRRCPINGRHQLQIRGKHLRRLMKAMPGLRQEGRTLVQS